jgi:hypothetical protein
MKRLEETNTLAYLPHLQVTKKKVLQQAKMKSLEETHTLTYLASL